MTDQQKKYIFFVLFSVLGIWIGILYVNHRNSKNVEPKVMEYLDTTDAKAVSKKLEVSQETAKPITDRIYQAQQGETQPNVTYYIQASDVRAGANQVAADIKSGKANVPAVAAEKTDRTLITANEEKQKVDVYKINLNKNHKIKAGIMLAGDKTYYGVGYQQGKWEGMIYSRGKKINAGSITYTVAEW